MSRVYGIPYDTLVTQSSDFLHDSTWQWLGNFSVPNLCPDHNVILPMPFRVASLALLNMMMSSNENIVRVTGHCAGNSPVTDEFPSQRPVTRSFGVFFDLHLNKRLSKQSWGWWFETTSRSLWRHVKLPGRRVNKECKFCADILGIVCKNTFQCIVWRDRLCPCGPGSVKWTVITNPSDAETGLFADNYADTFSVDDLGPCVARTLASKLLAV